MESFDCSLQNPSARLHTNLSKLMTVHVIGWSLPLVLLVQDDHGNKADTDEQHHTSSDQQNIPQIKERIGIIVSDAQICPYHHTKTTHRKDFTFVIVRLC